MVEPASPLPALDVTEIVDVGALLDVPEVAWVGGSGVVVLVG
jgi:hypothetical protein